MRGSNTKARKRHAHKYAYIVVVQRSIFPRNVYNRLCIATKREKFPCGARQINP